MPYNQKHNYKSLIHNIHFVLIIRLLIILFALSFSRISLYFFNSKLFASANLTDLIHMYLEGLRFDLSVLILFSLIMIIGNTIPFTFRTNKNLQKAINLTTIIFVSLGIILNLIDAVYYEYTMRRMTFDIFNYLKINGGFLNLIPRFLIDFWYATLTAIILIVLIVFCFRKIKPSNSEKTSIPFYIKNSLVFIISLALSVVFFRGGFKRINARPLKVIDASLYAPAQFTDLVLNTPFSVIKTFKKEEFQRFNYFNNDEVNQIFNPVHSYRPYSEKPDSVCNVVVLILESFSTEHIGFFNHQKSYTPFLDSLFQHCLVIQGTANNRRSIEGIPAILSSLPTITNSGYLESQYVSNQIEGLAKTLSKHAYQTAFFHGGKNSTMNLDAYASKSGFNNYFGLNEYPNKEDFDGHWGIWDEPFLRYFKNRLNNFKQPFLAALFTLSSHHPYAVPDKYKSILPEGTIEIQKAISYTDLSLRKFFNEAKKSKWFDHTLFIITADHTSIGASALYKNYLGLFSIPIAFYAPGDSSLNHQVIKTPVQQADIFPSIIQYLGITDTLICFGNSIFDENRNPFAINYTTNRMNILDSTYMFSIWYEKPYALYKYKQDSLLQKNLINKMDYSNLLKLQKAFVQQYNNRMINNNLKYQSLLNK